MSFQCDVAHLPAPAKLLQLLFATDMRKGQGILQTMMQTIWNGLISAQPVQPSRLQAVLGDTCTAHMKTHIYTISQTGLDRRQPEKGAQLREVASSSNVKVSTPALENGFSSWFQRIRLESDIGSSYSVSHAQMT